MVRRLTVLVDTNIYFSALYSPDENEAEVLNRAIRGNLVIVSPDIVQEELRRSLVGKLGYTQDEADSTLALLPTLWVPREEYDKLLGPARAVLPHKEDSPILACAMRLKAVLLAGNKRHFNRPEIRRDTKVVTSAELLKLLEKLGATENTGPSP